MRRQAFLAALLLASTSVVARPGADSNYNLSVGGGGGGHAGTFVRGCNTYNFSGTTAACTMTAVTSGDYVIICGATSTGVSSQTIADNTGGNTYTAVASSFTSTIRGAMWIAGPISNGPVTFTTTQGTGSASGSNMIAVVEYSGLAAGQDSSGTAANAASVGSSGSNNEVTGSFTPGTSGDLVSACIIDASSVSTVGTGFTQRESNANGLKMEELTAGSTTSSQTAAFNSTGANTYLAIGAALK